MPARASADQDKFAARIADQGCDLQPFAGPSDVVDGTGRRDVEGENAGLDPEQANRCRGLPERADFPGDQHEVDAPFGQLAGEAGAHPLGSSHDQGPGSETRRGVHWSANFTEHEPGAQ